MSRGRERTQRHGGRDEPAADLLHRLDLIQYNWTSLTGCDQVTRRRRAALVVLGHELGIGISESLFDLNRLGSLGLNRRQPFRASPYCLLQRHHNWRSPAV